MPTLMGVFEHPHEIAAAAQRLRDRGYGDIETYSPAPFTEVDDAVIEKPSTVRLFTLIGGLTGVVTGYALTLWMANNWPIIVGGKPYSSVTPYTIIAFELTIPAGSVGAGRTVMELAARPDFPKSGVFAALHREGGTVEAPRGSSLVEAGTTVLLVAQRDDVPAAIMALTSPA